MVTDIDTFLHTAYSAVSWCDNPFLNCYIVISTHGSLTVLLRVFRQKGVKNDFETTKEWQRYRYLSRLNLRGSE